MHTTDPLVALDGVNKYFDDLHVLKDINLCVNRGEVIVVIGPGRLSRATGADVKAVEDVVPAT